MKEKTLSEKRMTPNKKLLMIFILLGILAFAIMFTIDLLTEDKEYFNHNKVSISESDYKAIQKQFKEYQQVSICNIENKHCIILHKYE